MRANFLIDLDDQNPIFEPHRTGVHGPLLVTGHDRTSDLGGRSLILTILGIRFLRRLACGSAWADSGKNLRIGHRCASIGYS